jgi:hypothetical protein
MPESAYQTRPLREDERDWLSEVLLARRGRALIVGRGRVRQVKDQLWNASVQGNNAADRKAKRVVPCSWLKPAAGGPMPLANHIRNTPEP